MSFLTLLSSLNKIVEKVMASQLIHFVEKNGKLRDSQFGFHRGRSCEMAAVQLLEYVSTADDDGMYCVAVFCDLSKAFDTINHPRLINKLRCLGIGGDAQ